ncbi:hypothetical protein VTL71DRAFT_12218 [Oculimacula yallundae]|uniref:Telomerase reverse transcriptase n=1 Tax=Oculimacula yallundae TaxID=86028 RepID=A0ABR4CSE8_9HELO
MPGKRKRKRSAKGEGDQKRQKTSSNSPLAVKESLLARYYPQVLSLKEYLLSKLPKTSKIRRKKINSVGKKPDDKKSEQNLARFLDETLVGVSKFNEVSQEERWKQWSTFSQRSADDSVSFANLSGVGTFSQAEIVDFAVWLLFSKAPHGKTQHLLCQGFRKDVSHRTINQGDNAGSSIPGIISTYPNSHVTEMKARPWPQILMLLGKDGEKGMIDLVLDCGIFLAVENSHGAFNQLSGLPLSELSISPQNPVITKNTTGALRSPSSISFVRNRMLYARAALNAKREVSFGLRHIHVLNRYPLPRTSADDQSISPHTIQVMMYIFPRQFGLHNVFTKHVDPRQTVQPFKDYTLREDEIKTKFNTKDPKIPKRLRGKAIDLVRKLQIRHSRCPYKLLLEHYCPISDTRSRMTDVESSIGSSSKFKTQVSTISEATPASIETSNLITIPPKKPSMMNHATPTANVFAFCRAVLSRLIPDEFWGSGNVKRHNLKIFHQNIDKFIELRRFESLSLHEVTQGLKITAIEWLSPPRIGGKTSQTDIYKRWEIFHEFLYYIFDSILIPLIRSNFHVTESNIHRYRLFYFRHDVWKSLAEPALASLKVTMFEEVKLEKAQKLLDSRSLGFSQIRLLPKETGVRPIMNLRRRALKKGYNNMNILGPSINSVLAPVYNVLSLEKTTNPSRLGSTLFSVGDLYHKLAAFKSQLPKSHGPLYFAKLDVTSAFDTIPQSAILALIRALPTSSSYRISKHTTHKPGDNHLSDSTAKPIRKWTSLAHFPDDFATFPEQLSDSLAQGKKNTIFTSSIVSQFRDRDEILALLDEHITRNMVKIGKRFYRQKKGIPQGSVLSSLLCNYFYADLEARHLSFLNTGNNNNNKPGESLLLRLIDDFLLITTNQGHAKRFLEVMHEGVPEYGVTVNPEKTLVNFEVVVKDRKVKRLVEAGFPYCGSFVDVKTLDVRRDRERRRDMAVQDSLTVEYSRVPGKAFGRKVLNTFKIQAHAMFLDTAFNSLATVKENLSSAFVETATKMWMYGRCLRSSSSGKGVGNKIVIATIEQVINLAFTLMKSKARNPRNVGYKCAINRGEVEWLAINAFREVLRKRQSGYLEVLKWLDERIARLRS